MSPPKNWRQKVESLQRAGLEYVDKSRAVPATSKRGGKRTQSNPKSVTSSIQNNESVIVNPLPLLTPNERVAQLVVLRHEVAGCTRCTELADTRTQTVFSDGTPLADICFLGEAPGADEDASGTPFVGKAGQLLTKIIEACKLKREEVYICNILKCRPPGNRNPMPEEIENCRPYLEQQLALVRPKMMVALGKFAAAHLLREKPEKVAITKLRGSIREYNGIPFIITLHPAYLLRNPAAKRDVWEDMKEVMRQIGKPID
ncbi:uracil-DNA glycosylase [bacterium]|nr:uracil-DNA glycosylase [bacterium]